MYVQRYTKWPADTARDTMSNALIHLPLTVVPFCSGLHGDDQGVASKGESRCNILRGSYKYICESMNPHVVSPWMPCMPSLDCTHLY